MKLIIDRFEKDTAVCELEDGSLVDIPKKVLAGAKENEVIEITVNKDETNKRKEHIKSLMNDVFE